MRLAMLLLCGSIALCSCSVRQPAVVQVTVPVVACPAPSRPILPELNPGLPLDHPVNVEALMIRDDAMRAYIHGMESALDCYREQAKGATWE